MKINSWLVIGGLLIPILVAAQPIPENIGDAIFSNAARDPVERTTYSGATQAKIDWEKSYIVVSAYGAASRESAYNIAEEKKQAADAAYLAAIEKVAEILIGVRVTGEKSLSDYQSDGLIRQKINGFLKGVEHLEQYDQFEEMPDGSILAQVTVGAPLYGSNGAISNTVLEPIASDERANAISLDFKTESREYERFTPTGGGSVTGTHSGLILDCREMAVKPGVCVAPRIITKDKKTVYGVENVPRQIMLNGGIMGYTLSMENPVVDRKVGSNPLIIKPDGVDDTGTRIIVSQSDANRIFRADEKDKFLDKAKVIVLM